MKKIFCSGKNKWTKPLAGITGWLVKRIKIIKKHQ